MSPKMEVFIKCQGVSNILWGHKFDVADSIKTVRTTFAKMLGMHPTSCQLYYNGDQLADQPIRQVANFRCRPW
ncbi:hypothetical protein WJX82_009629 [Trebouxia sp. C0006]